MNLDNLQFPDIVIAELYKNNLVDVREHSPDHADDETAKKSIPLVSEGLQYLGDHLKRTTILVYYPNDRYIADSQLTFLANVLKACSLNLADIAIINTASQRTSLADITNQLNPENLICFGIQPPLAGLPELPMFTITAVNEQMVLNAPALEAFSINNEESKLLKTKLWYCLKDLFKVQAL